MKKTFVIVFFHEFKAEDRFVKEYGHTMPKQYEIYKAIKEETEAGIAYKVWIDEAPNGIGGIYLNKLEKKEGMYQYRMEEVNSGNVIKLDLDGPQLLKLAEWIKGDVGGFSMAKADGPIHFEGFKKPEESTKPDILKDPLLSLPPSEKYDVQLAKELAKLYEDQEDEPQEMCACGAVDGPCECENEWDVEDEDTEVITLEEKDVFSIDSIFLIRQHDPLMADTISDLLKYLASTYGDKYAGSPLSTMGVILAPTVGKGFNMGNAAKYISRYITEGYSKSDNPVDVTKTIHYCLFELMRRNQTQVAND